MKSKDTQELHKWLNNLLKEKYINKADIKQILNDFDWDNSNQAGVMPKIADTKKEFDEKFVPYKPYYQTQRDIIYWTDLWKWFEQKLIKSMEKK